MNSQPTCPDALTQRSKLARPPQTESSMAQFSGNELAKLPVERPSFAAPCWLLAVSLLLATASTGCIDCQYAARTLIREPSEFCWKSDRKRSIKVYSVWADQAWHRQCSVQSYPQVSDDYVAGFKDGFVDYVFAGGSGEPPPVPPRRFWNVSERNPRGHSAADDWFAGYRHGARVAREEGYRDQAVISTSLFMQDSTQVCFEDLPAGKGEAAPTPLNQPELLSPGTVEPDTIPEQSPEGEVLPEAGPITQNRATPVEPLPTRQSEPIQFPAPDAKDAIGTEEFGTSLEVESAPADPWAGMWDEDLQTTGAITPNGRLVAPLAPKLSEGQSPMCADLSVPPTSRDRFIRQLSGTASTPSPQQPQPTQAGNGTGQ